MYLISRYYRGFLLLMRSVGNDKESIGSKPDNEAPLTDKEGASRMGNSHLP